MKLLYFLLIKKVLLLERLEAMLISIIKLIAELFRLISAMITFLSSIKKNKKK